MKSKGAFRTFTVNLSERHTEILDRICNDSGESSVAVIRRALEAFWLLHKARQGVGRTVFIKPDGTQVEVIIL